MSSKEENVRWIFDKLGWANAHELALDIYLASSTIPSLGRAADCETSFLVFVPKRGPSTFALHQPLRRRSET
jgi:hypothetical protein